jgi:uncharacterized membrane protein
MDVLRELSLVGAVVTTGLMAGIYLAFSIAVMPGLGRSGDAAYVEVMRHVNAAIPNPVFLVVFIGPLVLDVVAVATRIHGDPGLGWTELGLVLYVVTLILTGRVNIPLNNALDRTEPVAEARAAFERRWVMWNGVRTVVGLASFVALLPALVAL